MALRLKVAELSPWIEVRAARSAGPGGQHVNKVSTRVVLLFDLGGCTVLSDAHKELIRRRLRGRLARDGRLRVVVQATRSQARNRALAEQRLIELLTTALQVPKPRRPTRPTAAARQRRLGAKRQRGQIKRLREQLWGGREELT